MQTLQPEQGVLLLNATLPAMKAEHRITTKIIEAVPIDKGDYRPDPVSKSAMDLAWHIAVTDPTFIAAVVAGEFHFDFSRPEWVRNSADVAKWYAERFETQLLKLTQLSGEQLVKIIDFRGIRQLPAVAYLQMGLSHTIHHRGQLTVYLRPMGAKVPSIYGESYDDAEARKAAQAQA